MNSHVKDKANFHWPATGWEMREVKNCKCQPFTISVFTEHCLNGTFGG